MKYLLTFFALSIVFSSYAQLYEGFTLGKSKDEIGFDFIPNVNGSYTILSSSRTTFSGNENYILSNLNSNKNYDWLNFDTTTPDKPYSIIKTSDGGFLISGTRRILGWEGNNTYLLKLDNQFNIQWENHYGWTGREYGFNVIESKNGGFIVVGSNSSDELLEIGDFYILKTDLNGNIIWENKFGHVDQKDFLFDLKEDNQGNIYTVGVKAGHYKYSTFDFKDTLSKASIIKFNSNGAIIWEKHFGETYNNSWYKEIEINELGEIYALGSTQENSNGSFDILLSKLDTNGNKIWDRNFGNNEFDYGNSMFIDQSNIYIAGTSCTNSNNYSTDIKALKLDFNGSVIWEHNFGGNKSEYANKIKPTYNGLAIIGSTKSYGNGGSESYLIELSLSGDILYKGNTHKENSTITLYPNPANDYISVTLSNLDDCTKIPIEIFDSKGKLINHFQLDNQNTKQIDLTKYSKGIYLLKYQSNCTNEVFVSKFIVK